jgi:hypothetical protein
MPSISRHKPLDWEGWEGWEGWEDRQRRHPSHTLMRLSERHEMCVRSVLPCAHPLSRYGRDVWEGWEGIPVCRIQAQGGLNHDLLGYFHCIALDVGDTTDNPPNPTNMRIPTKPPG